MAKLSYTAERTLKCFDAVGWVIKMTSSLKQTYASKHSAPEQAKEQDRCGCG